MKDKEIDWKKFFSFDIKRDWKVLLFFLWLMYMVWAYKADTEKCYDVIENLPTYCEQSGCYYPITGIITPIFETNFTMPEIKISR